jgi:phytoene/squalene synthetase
MYSAAPVGRFVLEVHGENPAIWPVSDALCIALQIINHLQDCKADYRLLNRVYIPEASFRRHGITETALAEPCASPALRECIADLTEETQILLAPAALSAHIKDVRLALEVSVIEKVARNLLDVLHMRDPLSERVHLTGLQYAGLAAKAVVGFAFKKITG